MFNYSDTEDGLVIVKVLRKGQATETVAVLMGPHVGACEEAMW